MSIGKKCANCGKGVMYGHNMSHAKNRTNRTFGPNLHMARVMIGGIIKKAKLCTKCLRMLKRKMLKVKERPVASAQSVQVV